MTRKDLIDKLAREFKLKKKDSEKIVKFIFEQISEALKKGESVGVQNFGTFTVIRTKKRKVKLPSGEWIEVPPRKKILFHPSLKLQKLRKE